jgi:hypothetical protein
MWKRRFPYEEYNKGSQDPVEKRRWTEALEKWGPRRVSPAPLPAISDTLCELDHTPVRVIGL